MIRRTLLGIALTACVFLANLAAAEGGPSTEPVSIVTQPGRSFDLTLPQGWRVLPRKSDTDARLKLMLVPPLPDGQLENVPASLRVIETASPTGKPYKDSSLGGFAEQAASAVATEYTDGKVLAFEQLKIGGVAAYKVESTGHTRLSKGKLTQVNTQFLAIHDGKLYGLFYSSEPSVRDKYLPDVTKIVESFHWKGAPATQSTTQDSKNNP